MCLLWPPCGIGQTIILLSCGFHLSSSFFLSSFFFFFLFFLLFWPNLSGRRLDVYHTFIHMVWIDNRKKLVKQQYLPHTSSQYGELRPISGWDMLASLGHPSKFQRVSRQRYTTRHCSSGRQPNFAALNRGRHLYSAGRPSRWALAHVLVCSAFCAAKITETAKTSRERQFSAISSRNATLSWLYIRHRR